MANKQIARDRGQFDLRESSIHKNTPRPSRGCCQGPHVISAILERRSAPESHWTILGTADEPWPHLGCPQPRSTFRLHQDLLWPFRPSPCRAGLSTRRNY